MNWVLEGYGVKFWKLPAINWTQIQFRWEYSLKSRSLYPCIEVCFLKSKTGITVYIYIQCVLCVTFTSSNDYSIVYTMEYICMWDSIQGLMLGQNSVRLYCLEQFKVISVKYIQTVSIVIGHLFDRSFPSYSNINDFVRLVECHYSVPKGKTLRKMTKFMILPRKT